MTRLLSTLAIACALSLLSATGRGAHAQAPATSDTARATRRAAHRETARQERREEKAEGKERHPHIRAALRELEESKKDLQTAAHDFGGHRVDAIKAIDEAEKQLRLALQFDKK